MRRADRGADPGADFIRTIEIKDKQGNVVERKEVVSAKGLLHLAHNERLSKIRTRVVQNPTKENGETAIVLVGVVTSRGSFTGLGDANPRNVNARIAPHFIRMAETRALARALRAALDVGAVAIEELEEEFSFAETRHERQDRPRPEQRRDAPPETREHPPQAQERPADQGQRFGGGDRDRGNGSEYGMSDAQRRLLYRIAFERGHEGDGAREWLHKELGVDSLAKVGKRQASAFIDRLLQSNGSNGHTAAG